MQLRTADEAQALGRTMANYNKLKLLHILSIDGALPKGEIMRVLGLSSHGTVNEYVEDLINTGIVEEYGMLKDGRYFVHMVRLKAQEIVINFHDLSFEGWIYNYNSKPNEIEVHGRDENESSDTT